MGNVRWRDTVLDVRLHVEFIARELDGEGREIEVYRSGAGKSGGQRQKKSAADFHSGLPEQVPVDKRHAVIVLFYESRDSHGAG